MVTYVAEAIFLVPIIAVALYHAYRFDKNIPTGKWFHFLWGAAFVIPIAVLWFLTGKNWLLAGALVLERFLLFNPALNLLRFHRQSFFYIHKGKNGSWWDGFLSKVYVPVWVGCAVGFIIIQLFL